MKQKIYWLRGGIVGGIIILLTTILSGLYEGSKLNDFLHGMRWRCAIVNTGDAVIYCYPGLVSVVFILLIASGLGLVYGKIHNNKK